MKTEDFFEEREKLNDLVMQHADTNMKRLWHIDSVVYNDGALPGKTKELLGLIASLVLRCDDCIMYHTSKCKEAGITTKEFMETLTIGLTAGGSITIPHIRRAVKAWDEE